jgi:hypothetical protein
MPGQGNIVAPELLDLAAARIIIRRYVARGGPIMKSFIVACVAAIVIAIVGAVALDIYQKPADRAYATTGVRL